jgi:hypothetical protein
MEKVDCRWELVKRERSGRILDKTGQRKEGMVARRRLNQVAASFAHFRRLSERRKEHPREATMTCLRKGKYLRHCHAPETPYMFRSTSGRMPYWMFALRSKKMSGKKL